MVETTASLATRPESSETLFCHSPKPSGAKMGAMNAPSRPNMDCAGSVTICKDGEKDCKKPHHHAHGEDDGAGADD